jgi:hypothetical protein
MAVDPGASPAETKDLSGLTGLCAKPRERLPIRTRSSGVTQSAWRLEVSCDQGTGAIVVAEVSPRESYYRGEGVFLGWTQEELAAVHDALLRRSDEPPFELPQLG